MSKTILITGGAASGKSRWAVSYFAACDNVLYLRTANAVDENTMNRIEYGNKQNYVEWDVRTGVTSDLASNIESHKFVIFDSLAAYVSLIINQTCPEGTDITEEHKKQIEKKVIDDVLEMYDAIMVKDGSMIVITLETGFSVTPDNHRQAMFREILGSVNQRIANMSNEVYLSASGIQFKIK